MMHMTFYWGIRATILFDSWKTDSWLNYSLSLLACFLFSAFYQYMEDRRFRIRLLSKNTPSSGGGAAPLETPLLFSKLGGSNWPPSRFADAILFGINSAIGYFLMLAVMSFNAGVFLAVVVGLAVGYLIFRAGDEDRVLVVDNPCACA
ncbi:hypothetical protein ABFS82_01G006000 [Erythranthe guttata]|uniref:copper transporter 5 n=1 Tax=Erythranthe guttata TaxID=4155 RepID=UPI00064DE3C6|nr:PREDICTED: copper transporter 5 [Erythranthe guttata]|eukprot:XP_012857960.1 PREDICTED: copper transporter 5 [Erythranthe guttata]